MANASNRYGFKPFGNPPKIMRKNIATASQTWVKGDPLTLLTAGTLSLATAGSTSLHGVAINAVTNSTVLDEVVFYPFSVESLWIIQASGSLTYALLGDMVDIEGTSGAIQMNEDAGSTRVLQIVDTYTQSGDAEGTNCLGLVRCVKSSFDGTEVS